MLSWHIICLLLGVLPWAEASTANLDIWSFSPSCSKYKGASGKEKKVDLRKVLQTAFNDVLDVAEASVSSFETVLGNRTDESKYPDEYTKWNQIDEAMAVVVGLSSNPDKEQQATSKQWSQVINLFKKIKSTLPANQNDPAKGYNPDLHKLPEPRPMIVCGEADWKWVGLNSKVPYTSTKFKNIPEFQSLITKQTVGGWHLLHRWSMKITEKKRPIVCFQDRQAKVYFQDNMIVLCDNILQPEYYKVTLKALHDSSTLIKEGDSLESYRENLSFTLLYELMHWFGGLANKADGSVDLNHPLVWDNPAVDEDGKLLYQRGQALITSKEPVTQEEMKTHDLKKVITYGVELVWNLAVPHKESWAKYSGPDVAIYSAESLALLGTMLYLDKWNWADKGKARNPGKLATWI